MSKRVLELVKIKLTGDISSMISFMRGRTSKGQGFTLGTGLIIAVIIIAFGFMMFFSFGLATVMAFQMTNKNCIWLYFPMAFVSATVFSFIGTVFSAQSYLFDAKDNELLLSMPIKPSDVLLSRMISLYLLNFVYSNLLFIPVGVAYGIFFHFKLLTGFFYILSMFTIPLLVTALSSIFGFLLGKLAARIPNKNLLTIILGFSTIIMLSAITINFGKIVEILMNEVDRIADFFNAYLIPLYWYGLATSFDAEIEDIKTSPFGVEAVGILPFITSVLFIVYVVYIFLSRNFESIVTRKVSTKKKKYVRTAANTKQTNIQLALIRKEVGYFFSMPSYVMNAGMSTIMSILLGVGIIMRGNMIVNWLPRMFPDASTSLIGLAIGSSLALCCTLNDVTAPTISLEGKTIWILKSTPLNPMKIFFAKAMLAPIVSLPGVCFTAIASAITLDIKLADILFIFFIPIIACTFSGFLGVCVNLKLPRFDWTNEITVIKQSLSVIFTLLLSMFFTAVPFVVAIVPSAYLERFSSAWAYGICFVYFILLVVLEIFFLATDGKKIWDSL